MRARLSGLLENLRASYWFIPGTMALVAILLAVALPELDRRLDPAMVADLPFVLVSQPEGARSVLGAIASSMIGVAGTVFSVTMAAVVYASGNYGPRILTNFMNDRGNQLTLGTFIATFLYALLVLRTVHSPSPDGAVVEVESFVPVIATFVATLLAIASVGVLIYFIHHVPSNIYIVRVIDGVGRAIVRKAEDRFPHGMGEGAGDGGTTPIDPQSVPSCFRGEDRSATPAYAEIVARKTGYIQVFDRATLMEIAARHDLVIRLECRPGSFVLPGMVLFDVYPAERATEEVRDALSDVLVIAPLRSAEQDAVFLVDELGEIAARALSPGTNDPYTAVCALEWLTAVLCDFASRDLPSPYRLDGEGKLRIIALPGAFPDYLAHAFGNLVHYVARDPMTARRALEGLGAVARACRRPEDLAAVEATAAGLLSLSRDALSGVTLRAVERAGEEYRATVDHPRRRRPRPLETTDEIVRPFS